LQQVRPRDVDGNVRVLISPDQGSLRWFRCMNGRLRCNKTIFLCRLCNRKQSL
jgi:hypothetical protein